MARTADLNWPGGYSLLECHAQCINWGELPRRGQSLLRMLSDFIGDHLPLLGFIPLSLFVVPLFFILLIFLLVFH